MKKPAFNFIVEVVPMKPSALIQAAEIIREVTNVARRLQSQQRGTDQGTDSGNSESHRAAINLGAHRAMAAG